MRALLDTHTFIWAAKDNPRLSPRARSLIVDGDNEIFFSAVVALEIAIKHAIGRLDFLGEPPSMIPELVRALGFTSLPVHVSHAIVSGALPMLHRDPFDRLLIAQSQLERLPIITADPNIARYDVEIIW